MTGPNFAVEIPGCTEDRNEDRQMCIRGQASLTRIYSYYCFHTLVTALSIKQLFSKAFHLLFQGPEILLMLIAYPTTFD